MNPSTGLHELVKPTEQVSSLAIIPRSSVPSRGNFLARFKLESKPHHRLEGTIVPRIPREAEVASKWNEIISKQLEEVEKHRQTILAREEFDDEIQEAMEGEQNKEKEGLAKEKEIEQEKEKEKEKQNGTVKKDKSALDGLFSKIHQTPKKEERKEDKLIEKEYTELEEWQMKVQQDEEVQAALLLEDKKRMEEFEKWKRGIHTEIEESLAVFANEVHLLKDKHINVHSMLENRESMSSIDQWRNEFHQEMDRNAFAVETESTNMKKKLAFAKMQFNDQNYKLHQVEEEFQIKPTQQNLAMNNNSPIKNAHRNDAQFNHLGEQISLTDINIQQTNGSASKSTQTPIKAGKQENPLPTVASSTLPNNRKYGNSNSRSNSPSGYNSVWNLPSKTERRRSLPRSGSRDLENGKLSKNKPVNGVSTPFEDSKESSSSRTIPLRIPDPPSDDESEISESDEAYYSAEEPDSS